MYAAPLDLNRKLFSAKIELLFPTKTCEEASKVPVTAAPDAVVSSFNVPSWLSVTFPSAVAVIEFSPPFACIYKIPPKLVLP